MRSWLFSSSALPWLALYGALPALVHGTDILKTSGFSTCATGSDMTVNNINVQFNRTDSTVIFDVSGSSARIQNVTASLTVTAYGKQVYQREFDPCDGATKVEQLCPGRQIKIG